MQAYFSISLLFFVHSVLFFFNPYNSLRVSRAHCLGARESWKKGWMRFSSGLYWMDRIDSPAANHPWQAGWNGRRAERSNK
ncbi:hypothetical protein L873DRAFT_1236702 [Choiromyces venosus 120613-1]|uniref:Uncharacterized protein n=1 Tax=Choiromyces venosus 120613-1 TaxID=1336337 RepID=A0A3N4JDI5_9PEZI|nr:hypothetical protein L873DRAFT_1236702 [Choiromyces venosus 120613-1]